MTLEEIYNYIIEVTTYMYDSGIINDLKIIEELNINDLQKLCDKVQEEGNSVSEYNNTLTNILFCDRESSILKRIALTLFNRLHVLSTIYLNSTYASNNEIVAKSLANALNEMYYLEASFDIKTYSIFNELLDKEIKEHRHTNTVINELRRMKKDLEFIYLDNTLYLDKVNQEEYTIDYYNRELLDKKINACMDILANFTNADINDNITYSKAIAVKLYLRSLLICLNNLEELAIYDKVLDEKDVKNSFTKKMMIDAFIQNYFDLKEYYNNEGELKHGL